MECGQDGGDSDRGDGQSQRKTEGWRVCVPGKQRKRGAEKHEKSETERDGRYRERRAKGMPETSLKFPVTPGQCFKLFKALRFIKTGS